MGKMITVQRVNVVLDIPEYQKDEYLAKGFDVISSNGQILEHTVPSDVNTLKACYIEHLKQIAELKNQIAELSKNKNISSAKAVNEKSVKKTIRK